MAKADPALVEELLAAARAAVADPELRAKLVPEAVDDIDAEHLKMRAELFRKMPAMQKMVLGAFAAKARMGNPLPSSPARETAFLALRAQADRFCTDAGALAAFFAPDTLARIADDDLAHLEQELAKLAAAQRRDVELLLDMDERAEAREARSTERAAQRESQATDLAAKRAKFEEMKARLEEKTREMKARAEQRKG